MSYLLNVWMIFTFLSFPVVKVGDNIERELFQTFPCWALKFSFMAPLKPRRTYKIGNGLTNLNSKIPARPDSINRENMYITVRTTKALKKTLVPRYIFFHWFSSVIQQAWRLIEKFWKSSCWLPMILELLLNNYILFVSLPQYGNLTLLNLPLCLWNC